MIIVAGDSWGCGEWVLDQSGTTVMNHGGIAQYLREHGHDVINVSQAANSNWQTLQILISLLNNQTYSRNNHAQGYHIVGNKQQAWDVQDVEMILIFQAAWFQDYRVISAGQGTDSVANFLLPNNYDRELQHQNISQWQHRLSEMSQKFDTPVILAGGGSDCAWFSNFENEYPGVSVVCQSITGLCIDNNHQVDQPVFGCYNQEILQECKQKAVDTQDLEFLLQQVELGLVRKKIWENTPTWFSDGVHGNRDAHKKLFDLIFK
jgi:predicted amino acid-binding ACT domain protein